MKRILIAGCAAIAAMAAFAGTNKVASAAQDKEDAWAEARREREAQRNALEKIQGELKRQREERAAKVGREMHVDELLDIYADRTGKTILRDPSVSNTVIKFNLRDEKKFSKEEFIGVLETVLEMNGVHLEPFGEKLVNAFPSRVAASKGIPIIMTPKHLEEKGRIVSMMIPFKNISVMEAHHALEAYKSVAGLFVVYERTNSIVVTDVDKNINRMLEIVKAIDVAQPVMEAVFVRQIKYAKAQDVARNLSAIVKEFQKDAKSANDRFPGHSTATGPFVGKVVVLADERINGLIIATSKINLLGLKSLIDDLDIKLEDDCDKQTESTPVPQCQAKKEVESKSASAPKP